MTRPGRGDHLRRNVDGVDRVNTFREPTGELARAAADVECAGSCRSRKPW